VKRDTGRVGVLVSYQPFHGFGHSGFDQEAHVAHAVAACPEMDKHTIKGDV